MENENMEEIKIFNPWLSIWVRPRETISQITSAKPLKMVLLLGVFTGIELCVSFFYSKENFVKFSPAKILFICLLAGPVAGIAWIFITSILVKVTGYWLGGSGRIFNICAAVAWGNIPVICSLPLSILTMFMMPATEVPAFIQFIYIILFIWSFFITLNCLMHVQGYFSIWSAFFNVLLTELIIFLLLSPVLSFF